MLLPMGYTNAFDAYCKWQLGLEEERGSIKEGKYADFVILDKNILAYKKDQYNTIGDTKVLSTYFEGEKVYSANKE